MSEKKKKNLLKQKLQNSLPNQLPHPVYLLVQKRTTGQWGAAIKSVGGDQRSGNRVEMQSTLKIEPFYFFFLFTPVDSIFCNH